MRKIINTLWVVLCTAPALIAQNSNQNLLPNVIGPSPEVAQLGKFGSYDVNNFTGVPSISIPIYEIVAKDIAIPITLKYHPSGIKVSDRPSMVGLGWSLSVGGFISRQVLGLADELPEGYANIDLPESFNTLDANDLGYLNDVNRGFIDSEPDIFSYNFGSYSGKFILDRLQNSPDANNAVFTGGSSYFTTSRTTEAELGCDDDDVLMIPYQPVDIQPLYGPSSLGFKAFDPYGREYQFDAFETSKDVNEAINKRSGWKISKIISKNKSTAVEFAYNSRYGQVSHDRSYSVVVNDLVANSCPPGGGTPYSSEQGQYSYKEHRLWSTEQYIQTITYPLGKVEFG